MPGGKHLFQFLRNISGVLVDIPIPVLDGKRRGLLQQSTQAQDFIQRSAAGRIVRTVHSTRNKQPPPRMRICAGSITRSTGYVRNDCISEYDRSLSRAGVTGESGFVLQLIREDIACVFQRDPAARARIKVITTYSGAHAILLCRIANCVWHRHWRYLARLISCIARIWTSIDIQPDATIGCCFFIDHGSEVAIGETAKVGGDMTLYHGATLGGVSWNEWKRNPTLGGRVVVGAGAKLLGRITIGVNALAGANSVVIFPAPEDRTVAGIPGKVVLSRSATDTSNYGINLDHHLFPIRSQRLLHACLNVSVCWNRQWVSTAACRVVKARKMNVTIVMPGRCASRRTEHRKWRADLWL